MARYNINDWNQKIDRTNTIIRLGRNGIYYEYVMPLNADPYDFYNSAIDVRSHKSPTSKWPNGKRPGQYQPVGDKRYFNYFQLKKMTNNDLIDFQLAESMKKKIGEVFLNE